MPITRPAPPPRGIIQVSTKGVTSPPPSPTQSMESLNKGITDKSSPSLWKNVLSFLGIGVKPGEKTSFETLTENVHNKMATAWNAFTYYEPKLGQAIEATLGKIVGADEVQNINPIKVAMGKEATDFGGQKLMYSVQKKIGNLVGKSDQEIAKMDSNPFLKAALFVSGTAIDVATDPWMYLTFGGGEGAMVLTKEGKELGKLSKEGIKVLKEITKSEDLTKVGAEILESAKSKIAERFLAGEKTLIEKGGMKFAGKTLVNPDALNVFNQKIKDSKIYNFVVDSQPAKFTKNFFNTIFNPKWIGGRIQEAMPDTFYDAYNSLFSKNTGIKQEAVNKAVKFLGDLSPKEQEQFFDLANEGLGGQTRTQLVGKSLEEIKKIGGEISDNVLEKYHKYINEWRPELEARARNLGVKTEIDNYIKNIYPELQSWREKYLTIPQPIKDLKVSLEKERLSDEDLYKGFLNAQNFTKAEVNKMMSEVGDNLPQIVKGLKETLGLSKDPYLALSQEAAELGVRENLHNFIVDTIGKYGKEIKAEEANLYKTLGYSIYQPSSMIGIRKGVPTYAIKNGAIANFLNKFSTNVARNSFLQALDKLSNKIVNIYFYSPQSVTYHALHNVLYNTWLSGGIEAFDNITKGVEDVAKQSEVFQRAVKSGALRSKGIGETLKEMLDKELNRTSQGILSKIGENINPLSNNHLMNKIFWGSDSALRMNLFRNALDKGMADQEAANFVNHFAGNYKNLTEIEKSFFRLMYPYYSWFKTNVIANFGTWVSQPNRQLIPIKVQNALNEALSGRQLWQNEPGASWKINTGKKDEKGKDIYVNPAYAGTIVPQVIQDPVMALVSRMLSGPLPGIVSTLYTGKSPYEQLTNQQPIESMPGATFKDRFIKALQFFLPYEEQKAIKAGKVDWLNLIFQWDRAHPMWQNILNSILQTNTTGITPQSVIKQIEDRNRAKYEQAKIKQGITK